MIRLMHLLLITGLIVSAGWVYMIKYAATADAERMAQVRGQIVKEREAIAALKAQWARLSRPERLQDLAVRHLGMQPLATEQLTRVGELPAKAQLPADGIGGLIEALDSNANLATGAITPGKALDGVPVPLPTPRPQGGPR